MFVNKERKNQKRNKMKLYLHHKEMQLSKKHLISYYIQGLLSGHGSFIRLVHLTFDLDSSRDSVQWQ